MDGSHFITVNSLLLTVNTVLLLFAGYMARDAWHTIHQRMDRMEKGLRETDEAVARLEGAFFGRRASDHT